MTDTTYDVIKSDNSVPIKAWTKGVPLEDAARQQLLNVAQLPFIYKWVAAMPDVHWGIGATVGSVIPTKGAIIPAAVGVDIGFGMMAVKTSLHANHLPDNLHGIRTAIEKAVPHGRTDNGGKNDRSAWSDAPAHHLDVWAMMEPAYQVIIDKYPKLNHVQRINHLGTLGTGNHFIEVCLDENENVWFLLHSGSRGVGNRFGTFFIGLAKKDMRQWMINLPDQDLAYLPQGTEHFEDYVRAVHWAQDYALANRDLMMRNMIAAVLGSGEVPAFEANVEVVSCHHNYVTWEHHYGENVLITRKGAVRARDGDMGIIPGSMGARSYIVRGKGNPESFMSCSHGAGRAMSRAEAKRRFTLDDHAKATAGVECRKDADVIDETPMAYKSIDAMMEAQRDLVDVVHVASGRVREGVRSREGAPPLLLEVLMNPRQFIEQVFLAELSQIVPRHHFISFSLIGLGTEFLGACLDNYDFNERNLSGLRFRAAVRALYPAAYDQHADLLATHLRNGFAHQFRPGTKLELTKQVEAPSRGWKHLQPTAEGRVCLVAENLYQDFAEACRSVVRDIDAGKLCHPKLRTTYLTT